MELERHNPVKGGGLLQKWLRDEHRLTVCVDFRHSETNKIEGINSPYYDVNIYRISGGDAWKIIKISQIRDNYEEALEEGLYETLKLISKIVVDNLNPLIPRK